MKVEGNHEAIIDVETWHKVQKIKEIHNKSRVSQSNFKGEFILSGLLRCPVCGAGTVMSKRPKRNGDGYHLYYICKNFNNKGKTVCSSNLIKKSWLKDKCCNSFEQFLRKKGL